MIRFSRSIRAIIIALVALSLPCSLMAKPIVVSINDVPNGRPVIQVQGAPNGYALYTGPEVVDPAVEDGAAIVLYDVDLGGLLPAWGGRFLDPTPWQALPPWEPLGDGVNYRQYRTAVDILWVGHDPGIVQAGALVVAFDSALPGIWYFNPGVINNTDDNLGPVTDQWVTVYANDTLVVRYKPHTYVAKGYVPFNGSLDLVAGPATDPPEPIPDNPNAFVREYNGTGLANQLGAMMVWMKLTIYPDQMYPYTDPRGYEGLALPYSGSAVLTAANGNKVNCLVNGIEGLTEQPWWLEGDLQVTGGTGRFDGARGYMTFMGLEADTVKVVFDGTVTSVGKNNK